MVFKIDWSNSLYKIKYASSTSYTHSILLFNYILINLFNLYYVLLLHISAVIRFSCSYKPIFKSF
nr:MAG TPA: hypothetical protein [Caudoviricetes sp.]